MNKTYINVRENKFERRENKFKALSFEELMELTIPQTFYKEVTSKEDLQDFIIMLHRTRCKDLGIRYLKVVFQNFDNDNFGEFDDKSINITRDYLKIFEACRKENNLYFPFAVARTVLHETRHHWQHQKEKELNDKNLSLKDRLSIASGMRFSDKNVEFDDILSNYQMERNLILEKIYCSQASQHIENIRKEYSNSPHEMDANDDVVGIFENLYLKTHDKNLKIAERELVENVVCDFDEGEWSVENILKENNISQSAKEVFKEYQNFAKKKNAQEIDKSFLFKMYDNLSRAIEKEGILSVKEGKDVGRFYKLYDRCQKYKNNEYCKN